MKSYIEITAFGSRRYGSKTMSIIDGGTWFLDSKVSGPSGDAQACLTQHMGSSCRLGPLLNRLLLLHTVLIAEGVNKRR